MTKPFTRGAIIGVICMFIGFFMCVIAIGAPFWYQVNIDGVDDPQRTLPQKISARINNTFSARYGLWEMCSTGFILSDASEPRPTVTVKPGVFKWDLQTREECLNLVVTSWDFFRGTQAMMVIALMLIIASIVCSFLYCMAGSTDLFIILFSVLGVAGAVFVMIAGVIFGLSAPGHILENYNYPQEVYNELELVRLHHFTTGSFQWAYSLGLASGIFALIGSVFATVQWEAIISTKVYVDGESAPQLEPLRSDTLPAASTSV